MILRWTSIVTELEIIRCQGHLPGSVTCGHSPGGINEWREIHCSAGSGSINGAKNTGSTSIHRIL